MKQKVNKQIFFILISCLAVVNATGQTGTPQQIMTSIYKSYDSTTFLTFDLKFTYASDTLYGKFSSDKLEGTYTMSGKKARYNLGNIDFLQNDSFFITVYNDDKIILVADPRTNNVGNELPMRQAMDSLIQAYGQHYNITQLQDSVSGLGKINFEKSDSLAQFLNFAITYKLHANLLNSIEYKYEEYDHDDSITTSTIPTLRKKMLFIEFLNYRGDNFSDSDYSENNFIWFEDGECKPVAKYKDYKIYYSKSAFNEVQNLPAQ